MRKGDKARRERGRHKDEGGESRNETRREVGRK